MPKQYHAEARSSDREQWADQVRSCMGDEAWRAVTDDARLAE